MHISFRKNPSSILIICALCVVFLIGSVFGHLNAGGSSADRSFQAYTDRLFREEVSGNMLNLHYSIAYPEKQQITRPAPTLGTVSAPDDNSIARYEEIIKKLQAFDPSKLSEANQITLDMLLLYYKTQQRSTGFYLLEEYRHSFLSCLQNIHFIRNRTLQITSISSLPYPLILRVFWILSVKKQMPVIL